MNCIRKENIVSRKSYNNDILFCVEDIIDTVTGKYAILKGITLRIKANAPISDLCIENRMKVKREFAKLDERIEQQITENRKLFKRYMNILCGKILHLDGDRKYAEKATKYYKKIGLDAVVKNIPENKQYLLVGSLIRKYKPDILVITGHDGMIKNGTGFTDIYNYRNSRYFIETVKEARRATKSKEIIIFAGACQSFFEAIMDSGANFASSPARVLIDFMDPLIIAEKVAITPEDKKITKEEIAYLLKDDNKRVSGRITRGTRKKYTL